jgi:hypothetical protein
MSKFLELSKEVTVDDLSSLLKEKKRLFNAPYVTHIESNDDLEDVLSDVELTDEEKSYVKKLNETKVGFTEDHIICERKTVLNNLQAEHLDMNFQEVDLGITTKDGKKILFADRNFGSTKISDPGAIVKWADIEESRLVNNEKLLTSYLPLAVPGMREYLEQLLSQYAPDFDSTQLTDLELICTLNEVVDAITGPKVDDMYKPGHAKFESTGESTDADSWSKYNSEDGKNTLEPEDDIVSYYSNGEWRIPTYGEFKLLFENVKNGNLTARFIYKEYNDNSIIYKKKYADANQNKIKINRNPYTYLYDSLDFTNFAEVTTDNLLGIEFTSNITLRSLFLPLNCKRSGGGYEYWYDNPVDGCTGYWTSSLYANAVPHNTDMSRDEEYDHHNFHSFVNCVSFIDKFEVFDEQHMSSYDENNIPGLCFDWTDVRWAGLNIRPVKIVDAD